MKKLFAVSLTLFVITAGMTQVFAAIPGTGRYFVDTDGNGICDYAENGHRYTVDREMTCRNGNVGASFGMSLSRYGKNFVDEDGDGVCDNYKNRTPLCNGSGYANGFHGGRRR